MSRLVALLLLAACSSMPEPRPLRVDGGHELPDDAGSPPIDAGAAAQCTPPQVNASGLCSAPPPAGVCGTNPFGADGCGSSAICLPNLVVDGAVISDRKCYAFPACEADGGGCPVGPYGSLCNLGFFTDKPRFCVPTLCLTERECPSAWSCVHSASKAYGYCSDRALGSLCGRPTDCASGQCRQLSSTSIGTCY